MKRLKPREIPDYKRKLLKEQNGKCGLCGIDLSTVESRDICLDHDHKTGHVRAVLCRNCNGIEGKIYNLANRGKRSNSVSGFVRELLLYWEKHKYTGGPDMVYHPQHRTEDEKRLERNKKARLKRAREKAKRNVSSR